MAEQWYVTAGYRSYELASPFYRYEGVMGVQIGVGSKMQTKKGNWFFGSDISWLGDPRSNQDVLITMIDLGGRVAGRTYLYGKLGLSNLYIEGYTGAQSIDAGVGLEYKLSENVSLRLETVRPINWLHDESRFEGRGATRTNLGMSYNF